MKPKGNKKVLIKSTETIIHNNINRSLKKKIELQQYLQLSFLGLGMSIKYLNYQADAIQNRLAPCPLPLFEIRIQEKQCIIIISPQNDASKGVGVASPKYPQISGDSLNNHNLPPNSVAELQLELY